MSAAHFQYCSRDGFGIVRRGDVMYLTPDEHQSRADLLRQTQMGWLEPVPAPPGEATEEEYRATHTARLTARVESLQEDLARAKRELLRLRGAS